MDLSNILYFQEQRNDSKMVSEKEVCFVTLIEDEKDTLFRNPRNHLTWSKASNFIEVFQDKLDHLKAVLA